MRVLFVTPECAPLTKTGGLGDVSAALPAALRALGNDVRVLLPRYREIDPAGAEERARLQLLGTEVRLLEKSDCLLLDAPSLYDREGTPYQDAGGGDWPDNWLRFGVLSAPRRCLRAAPRRSNGVPRSCIATTGQPRSRRSICISSRAAPVPS